MTTWNAIPDSDVDAESPLNESLSYRWRDNPIAVAEGDPSVPVAQLVNLERQRTTSLDSDLVFAPDGTGRIQLRRAENNKSPYALRTLGVVLNALLGMDGPITSLGTGGVFFATTVNITSAQTPTRDVHIFATGDVTISDDVTMEGFTLEISTTGSIIVNSGVDIVARHVRLFAGEDITLDTVDVDCIVESAAVQERFFNVFAATCTGNFSADTCTIDAALCFVYAGGDLDMLTCTVRMYTGGYAPNSTGASDEMWTTRVGNTPATSTLSGSGWGKQGGGLRDEAMDPATLLQVQLTLPDYMSPHAGFPSTTANIPGGPNHGYGFGGSGPRGGGDSDGGPAAPLITLPAWCYPCAPGGGGATGSTTAGPLYNGGRGAPGGGVCVLFAEGDMDLTSSTINCDGADGGTTASSGGYDAGGGGGGGAIKASCRGTMTGGTLTANGGYNGLSGSYSPVRNGGGGVVSVLRGAVGVSQTLQASGANAGTATTVVLTDDEFTSAKQNGFLER